MSLLSIENLTVRFGTATILDDVSLRIGKGEFVGLIGPNGAGKSTLLKAILNLVKSHGKVSLAGQDSATMTADQRAIVANYLPQDRDVYWPVDVEKLVGLGRERTRNAFSGPSQSDRLAVDAAMERMDVTHLRKRPATELSGGERARVLIARMLAQDTPLMLADEPTSGLDPSHQIALMSCFAGLAAESKSVVCCLHEISLTARWCDRIIVIDKGSIFADGPPEEVLTQKMMQLVYGVEAYESEFRSELVFLPWNVSSNGDKNGR